MSAAVLQLGAAAFSLGAGNLRAVTTTLALSIALPVAAAIALVNSKDGHAFWTFLLVFVAIPFLRFPVVILKLLCIHAPSTTYALVPYLLRICTSTVSLLHVLASLTAAYLLSSLIHPLVATPTLANDISALYLYLSVTLVVLQGWLRWYVSGYAGVFSPPTAWTSSTNSNVARQKSRSTTSWLTGHIHASLITGLEDSARAVLLLTPVVLLLALLFSAAISSASQLTSTAAAALSPVFSLIPEFSSLIPSSLLSSPLVAEGWLLVRLINGLLQWLKQLAFTGYDALLWAVTPLLTHRSTVLITGWGTGYSPLARAEVLLSQIAASLPSAAMVAAIVSITAAWESTLVIVHVTKRVSSLVDHLMASNRRNPAGATSTPLIRLRTTALAMLPQESLASYMVTFPTSTGAMAAKDAHINPRMAMQYLPPPWLLINEFQRARSTAYALNPAAPESTESRSPLTLVKEALSRFATSAVRFLLSWCRVSIAASNFAGTETQEGSSEAVSMLQHGADVHTVYPVANNVLELTLRAPRFRQPISVTPLSGSSNFGLTSRLTHTQHRLITAWQRRMLCGAFALAVEHVAPLGVENASSEPASCATSLRALLSSFGIHFGALPAVVQQGHRIAKAVRGNKHTLDSSVIELTATLQSNHFAAALTPKNALLIALRDALLCSNGPSAHRPLVAQPMSAGNGAYGLYRLSSEFLCVPRSSDARELRTWATRNLWQELSQPIAAELIAVMARHPTYLESTTVPFTSPAAATSLHRAVRLCRQALTQTWLLSERLNLDVLTRANKSALSSSGHLSSALEAAGATTSGSVRRRRMSGAEHPQPRHGAGLRLLSAADDASALAASRGRAAANNERNGLAIAAPPAVVVDAYLMANQPEQNFRRGVLTDEEIQTVFADNSGETWNDVLWTCTGVIDALTVNMTATAAGPKRPAADSQAAKARTQIVELVASSTQADTSSASSSSSSDDTKKDTANAGAGASKVDIFKVPSAAAPPKPAVKLPKAVENTQWAGSKITAVVTPFFVAWANLLHIIVVEPLVYIRSKFVNYYNEHYKPRITSQLTALQQQMHPYNPRADALRWGEGAGAAQLLAEMQTALWDVCGVQPATSASADSAKQAIRHSLQPPHVPLQQRVQPSLLPSSSAVTGTNDLVSDAGSATTNNNNTEQISDPLPHVHVEDVHNHPSSALQTIRRFYASQSDVRYALLVALLFVSLPLYMLLVKPNANSATSLVFTIFASFIVFLCVLARIVKPYAVKVRADDEVPTLIAVAQASVAANATITARVALLDGLTYPQVVIGLGVQVLVDVIRLVVLGVWFLLAFGIHLAVTALPFIITPTAKAFLLHKTDIIRWIGGYCLRTALWVLTDYILYLPLAPFKLCKAVTSAFATVLRDAFVRIAKLFGKDINVASASGSPTSSSLLESPYGVFTQKEPPLSLCLRSPSDVTASVLADYRAVIAAIDMLASVVEASKALDRNGVVQDSIPVVVASLSACLAALVGYVTSQRYRNAYICSDELYGHMWHAGDAWGDDVGKEWDEGRKSSAALSATVIHDGSFIQPTLGQTRPAAAAVQAALRIALTRISHTFPEYYDALISKLPSPVLIEAAKAAVITVK